MPSTSCRDKDRVFILFKICERYGYMKEKTKYLQQTLWQQLPQNTCEISIRSNLSIITLLRSKGVILSLQTDQWFLNQVQPVLVTGVMVVICEGWVAEYFDGEASVKIWDQFTLVRNTMYILCDRLHMHTYTHACARACTYTCTLIHSHTITHT